MPRGVPNRPAQVPGESAAAPVAESVSPEVAAAPEPAPAPRAPAAGLPHPDDIDPKTLKGSIMTSEGWMCPDDSDKPQRR